MKSRIPSKTLKKLIERADQGCEAHANERCEGRGTQSHHRNRNRRDNRLENLIRCCWICHTHIHLNPAESYAMGFLVHKWDDPAEVPVKVPA